MQVLVVDADQAYLDIVSIELSLFGAEVSKAQSVKEALRQLEQGSFDLVLTDITIQPGEWGSEITDYLAQRNSSSPCLFFSNDFLRGKTPSYKHFLGAYSKLEFSKVISRMMERMQLALIS